MKRNTKYLIALMLVSVLIFTLTGCGAKDPTNQPDADGTVAVQTETAEKTDEIQVDIDLNSDQKSVDLPADYPQTDLPIYKGSYVESVVSVSGSNTIIAHSKDTPEQVIEFYKAVIKKGTVNVESTSNGVYVAVGTIGKNTFQMSIAKEESLDNFETMFSIFLMPVE